MGTGLLYSDYAKRKCPKGIWEKGQEGWAKGAETCWGSTAQERKNSVEVGNRSWAGSVVPGMRRFTDDKKWVMVDELRPVSEMLDAVVGLESSVALPDIKTEVVREVWWVGFFPFPTPGDIMDALQEFRVWRGVEPDRIIFPNLAGAHMFGVEVQYGRASI